MKIPSNETIKLNARITLLVLTDKDLHPICYRELLVVYDEKTDSSVKKLEIARTITYGMVHQLLDNEIGLPWWSELWLREGLIFLLHAKILNEVGLYYYIMHYSEYYYTIFIRTMSKSNFIHNDEKVSFILTSISSAHCLLNIINYNKLNTHTQSE